MTRGHDEDLDQLFEDPDLRALAHRLSGFRSPEPPLDAAFRSSLRRQLMQQAWSMAEPRLPWWRRLGSPTSMAWAGASVGLLLIAFVAYSLNLSPPTPGSPKVNINIPDTRLVAVDQPIQLTFTKPMDKGSVTSALSIEPATRMTQSWNDGTVLTLRPNSGTLAPNTQYTVRMGQAKTADQKPVPGRTALFITDQPAANPTPSPTGSPRPTLTRITGQTELPGSAGSLAATWAAGRDEVFYTAAQGTLTAASPNGGPGRTLNGVEGANLLSVSPDGSQVAFSRAGQVGVIAADGRSQPVVLNGGETAAMGWQIPTSPQPKAQPLLPLPSAASILKPASSPTPSIAPVPLARLIFVQATTVFTTTPGAQSGSVTTLGYLVGEPVRLYLAPGGNRLIYQSKSDGQMHLLDLTSGADQLTQLPAGPLTWSTDGSHVAYASSAGIFTSDPLGQGSNKLASLADLSFGSPDGISLSWSSRGEILASNQTSIWILQADGSERHSLDDGEFGAVSWSPGGDAFTFRRGNALLVAHLGKASQSPLADGGTTVKNFMNARVAGHQAEAMAMLDEGGRAAYQNHKLKLLIQGDPQLTRYFIVLEEATSNPDGLRYTVRLVLSHPGAAEAEELDENLLLIPGPGGNMVIHQATPGSQTAAGKGPSVVAVRVELTQVTVTFDSDLDGGTVPGAVTVKDSNGRSVSSSASYGDHRTVIVKVTVPPIGEYRLDIATSLKDFNGRHLDSEYLVTLTPPVHL